MAKQTEDNDTTSVQIKLMVEQRERWENGAKARHYLSVQDWIKALIEKAFAEDDARLAGE
jgi:hypothetical protein